MGWSYRKSFGSGPFRINFSKRGISYSVGIKGARVNIGPRGTYVNLSSHGISYRRKISDSVPRSNEDYIPMVPVAYNEMHTIASAEIEQLTDTDSKQFISELTEKASQISYVRWFGVFPLIVFLLVMLFTSFGSRTVITKSPTDSTLARVVSEVGLNIRKEADSRSGIVRAATNGESFHLLDSNNRKWLKIGFHDSTGYISRRFATIEHVHHEQQTEDELFLANSLAGYLVAIGMAAFIVLINWLRKLDKKRFEMELHYEMDEQLQQVYQQFANHFANFSHSSRIWQHLNAYQTNDYKRNGGAGKLVKRTSIRSISANQPPLPHFITNVAIPCIKLNNLDFYFLPERLLIKRGNTFAAVFYKKLQISSFTTRFIEDESVPSDAKVVDHTWRYVNKHGGPDRRFNNNRQLPICAYSEYNLTSDTGIYEVLMTSKQGAMDAFAGFLAQIGDLQSRMKTTDIQ
ncbi:MAG: DUF4236 domain-containing protein [Mucilaginibacter sp.]